MGIPSVPCSLGTSSKHSVNIEAPARSRQPVTFGLEREWNPDGDEKEKAFCLRYPLPGTYSAPAYISMAHLKVTAALRVIVSAATLFLCPAVGQQLSTTAGSEATDSSAGAQYSRGLDSWRIDDYAEALKWFRLAAEQGHADAQFFLGYMYDHGQGVPENDAEAVNWYRLAAEQGIPEAQFNLGLMYEKGQGVQQSSTLALKWFRQAADGNDVDAQVIVGRMYRRGDGVTQDYAEAVKWFRLAAEQGDAVAQYVLGVMLDAGQGVTQDFVEAAKWYRSAAEQGDADSQFALGTMYDRGRGVPSDYREGAKWMLLAAEQGVGGAQYYLGLLYVGGRGVLQDYHDAHKWLNIAASRLTGDERGRAAKYRDQIADEMTSTEVAEAQRRAREWKPKPWSELKWMVGQ